MTHKQYLNLITKLQKYNYDYHYHNQSSVSDDVYDSLMLQLKAYEAKHPNKVANFSPSQRVGAKMTSSQLTKRTHLKPMLSLNDVFDFKEVIQWQTRLQKFIPSIKLWHYFVDIKMDGLALTLIYEDGILKQAITRGDGQLGEDVTHNAKTLTSIPLKLNPKQASSKSLLKGRLEIRGEVIIYKKDFEKINLQAQKEETKIYANARNLAAGSMRQLDPKIVASRSLIFRAYDIAQDNFKTHQEVYKILRELNFLVNDEIGVYKSLDSLEKAINKLETKRDKLEFETDGLVIKINDRQNYDQLGVATRSPRGALAYKYQPQQAVSIIKDIKLQIGRTGVITPVAILKPTQLSGSTVSRASLHNMDEIKRLDVRINDQVVVVKAGDVIPKVIKVLKDLRPKSARVFNFKKALEKQYPKSEYIKLEGEVAFKIKPSSSQLNHLLSLQIIHYASRSALNIVGLGSKTCQDLVNSKLVKSLADIYSLELSDLIELERLAELSANNLLKAIASAKKPSLDRFIYGLGIEGVGQQTALDLANHFQSLDKFMSAPQKDLENIQGIGLKGAEIIFNWHQNPINQQLIKDLKKQGVKPHFKVSKTHALNTKKIVITGSFEDYSRWQIKQMVEACGAVLQDQVSSKTDYLIIGKSPGRSKVEKAKTLKTKILKPQDLLKLLKN